MEKNTIYKIDLNGYEGYLTILHDRVFFWDSEHKKFFELKEKMFERGPVEDWSGLLGNIYNDSYIFETRYCDCLDTFLEILFDYWDKDIFEQIANERGIDIFDFYDTGYHSITKPYSFEKLSDFDYKDDSRKVFLDCEIKKVLRPKLGRYSSYIQQLICYDDNTNFELEVILPEEFADFDKWKKNDNIRLIGKYNKNQGYVKAYFIRKMNPTVIASPDDIDDDVKLSRSQEVDGYDEWRNTILEKDDHKCVCCGLDKHLHVHHLFGYAEHPELAVDENNGVTLCKFCHDRYHSIYGVKNINPRDFIEYISKYGV